MTSNPQNEEEMMASQPSETSEQKAPCSNCHTNDSELDYLTHEDKNFCADCYNEQVANCAGCSKAFWQDDLTSIYEKSYCGDCTSELFRFCSHCEKHVDQDRGYYSEIHDCDYCENCFSNYVSYCVSCDCQIDAQSCHVDDGGEPYCDGCWENREDDPERSDYLEFSCESFSRCNSRRKYGIEIEALLEESTDHMSMDHLRCWRQVHDGSLGDHGREFVSPILQGDQGFKEIEEFTNELKGWGYFIRQSCGLHVHIDGRDLACEHVKMLLKITRYFEPVLYAMLPPSRYRGTYSVPLERIPKSRFRISVRDEDALKKLWYGRNGETVNLKTKYHHSRYFGLNIHSWFFRRSLEFRYHSGTLNSLKITNFITICQAFVDKAKELKRFKLSAPVDFPSHLESFVSFFGLSSELALYVRQRIMKFQPERLMEAALAIKA